MRKVVILGGGTGGTLVANRLRRLADVDEMEITVVDLDNQHVYQPGLLFVPFGLTHTEDIVRPRSRQLRGEVTFIESAIERVETDTNQVHLVDGQILFFTFFGLDAIHKARHEHIKLSTVGNPGLHMPTMVGGIPGVSTAVTHYMNHKMEKLDIPSIPEFIEMISDSGAGLYACQASVDLFGLEKNDFIPQVDDIITVGEFYDRAAGGQIIFT